MALHGSVLPSTPRLNLDRHGMARDYATYVWLLYGRDVTDQSPQRRAFLQGPGDGWARPDLGTQRMMR